MSAADAQLPGSLSGRQAGVDEAIRGLDGFLIHWLAADLAPYGATFLPGLLGDGHLIDETGDDEIKQPSNRIVRQ